MSAETSSSSDSSVLTPGRRLCKILKVSRVPGWTFGPILFGIGLIHSEALPKSLADLAKAGLQVFALSMPLCVVVFGVNDVYDYDSDRRNPRKKTEGLEGGVLPPMFHQDVLRAAWLSSAFVLGSSVATGRPQNILANATLILLGWQYSSPPLRLKEVPLVDSISNGAMVFLCWFAGFSSSGRGFTEVPSKGYMMSLCTAGVHALGAVMDVEADRAAGQKTIAVVLGKRQASVFAALCYVAASMTVEAKSIFGVYVRFGAIIMILPIVKPQLAHRSFRAIVIISVAMALAWLSVRGKEASQKILAQKHGDALPT